MRVLHIITDSNVGGAGILLSNLTAGLETRGISCPVLLPRGSRLTGILKQSGAEVNEIDMTERSFFPRDMLRIAHEIKRFSPDAVHTHACLTGRIAARICGIKSIFNTRHCAWERNEIGRLSLPRRMLYEAVTDMTVATARAALSNLAQMGINMKKTTLILNGAGRVKSPSPGAKERFLKKYGVPPNSFAVGMSARLSPEKGQEILICAAEKVISDGFNAVFILAGDGADECRLKRLTLDKGLMGRIIFTGYISAIGEFYNSIDLHVNCSVGTETSSLSISEAMSAGVPSVVSDFGGNTELVTDGINGLVFPSGDAGALAERIERLISDPSALHSLGDAAAKRYDESFSAERMCAEYEKMYRATVGVKTQAL